MGRAAGEGSDLVVLTSDNPRSEEPMVIIEEALVGVRETGTTCIVEEDRAGAIEIAIRAARPGDIVLIAGKGHEKVQILKDGTVPFDDVAVAAGGLEGDCVKLTLGQSCGLDSCGWRVRYVGGGGGVWDRFADDWRWRVVLCRPR